MPHFFRDNREGSEHIATVLGLEHHTPFGDGSCVALVKQFTPTLNGRTTRQWKQGSKVTDLTSLSPGTAIATFYNGRWPGWDAGNHAAFFLRVSGREDGRPDGKITEIVVMDQFHTYAGQPPRPWVTTRKIGIPKKPYPPINGPPNLSNDLNYFYVIE